MKIIPVNKNALLNDLSAMCIDDYDYEVYSEVFDMIDQAPVLDYAPVVHAHWIYDPNAHDYNLGGYICSNCKKTNKNLSGIENINPMMLVGSRFCPNCGAIMDLPEEYREER